LKGDIGKLLPAFDAAGTQVTSSTSTYTIYRGTSGLSIANAVSSTSTITFPTTTPVSISGTGYTIQSQPSLTPLTPDSSVTYNISDSNSTNGNLGYITIIAQDSTTNALFSMTFNVVDTGAP